MNTRADHLWLMFENSAAHLASFALAVVALGWLAVQCRVPVRARLAAGMTALIALAVGSLAILLAPLVPLDPAPVPVASAVWDKVNDAADAIVWVPGVKDRITPALAATSILPREITARTLGVAVWLAGLCWALVRLWRDWRALHAHLRRLREVAADRRLMAMRCVRRSDSDVLQRSRLLSDPDASSPYSCGVRRPALVLPDGWPCELGDAALAAALAHECAHLRHRDSWTLLAWRVAKALWWWNPVVHALAAKIDELLEWRADDEATHGDVATAVTLSRTLVNLVSGACAPRLTHAIAAPTARLLRRRMMRLLDASGPGRAVTMLHAVMVAVLAASAIAVLAGCAAPLFGGKPSQPLVGGEIIHTTPDAWPAAARKLGVFSPARQADGTDLGDTSKALQSRLESAMRRFGQTSDATIAAELRLVESPAAIDASNDAPWSTRVLSENESVVWLRSMARDGKSKTISYPRIVTRDGCAVLVRSVVNQPVAAGPKRTAYAPAGTTIGLGLVKRPGGRTHLDADITISKIIGNEKSNGNDCPVISWANWCTVDHTNGSTSSGFVLPRGTSLLIALPHEPGKRLDLLITPRLVTDGTQR